MVVVLYHSPISVMTVATEFELVSTTVTTVAKSTAETATSVMILEHDGIRFLYDDWDFNGIGYRFCHGVRNLDRHLDRIRHFDGHLDWYLDGIRYWLIHWIGHVLLDCYRIRCWHVYGNRSIDGYLNRYFYRIGYMFLDLDWIRRRDRYLFSYCHRRNMFARDVFASSEATSTKATSSEATSSDAMTSAETSP